MSNERFRTFQLPLIPGNPTVSEIQQYLENAWNSFNIDPPDTDFQRGYRQAISDTLTDLFDGNTHEEG